MAFPEYFPPHADRSGSFSYGSASTASPGWPPETPPDSLGADPARSSLAYARQTMSPQHSSPYHYQGVPTPLPSNPSLHFHAAHALAASSSPASSSLASSSSWPWSAPVDGSAGIPFAGPPPPDVELKPKRGRGRPRKLPILDVPPKIPGQKGQRSKTGCVTCRKRKKKCDEAKPTCINCRKNGKDCGGYSNVEPANNSAATNANALQDTPKREKVKVEEKHSNDDNVNDNEPHRKDEHEDVNDDDDEEEEDEEEEEEEEAAASASTTSDDYDYDNDDIGTSDPASAKVDRRLQANFDMHASKFFPPWLHRPNAFRNVMEPLAQKHEGVRCGLLCLSAQHLLQQNPNDRILQERYRVHLGSAVRYSIDLYQQCGHSCTSPNPDSSDAYIALALIFCIAHEISGHDEFEGVMHGHYNTIAHMAIQCPQKSKNAAFQRLLKDTFLSRNSIALVTSMDRGIRNSDFCLPEFVQMDAVSLFGGARGLWVELSHIHTIRQRIRDRGGSVHSPDWPEDLELHTAAQSLEHALLEGPVEHTAGTHLHAAAMLYRASALVYLYRTIMPSRPHYKISYRVNEGLVYLDQLMQKTATQGVLLMPLFLLGCAAFEAKQRQQISQAFRYLLEQPLNGNIQRSHTIVQAVWQRMDMQSDESWDWEALGQQLGCTLIAP